VAADDLVACVGRETGRESSAGGTNERGESGRVVCGLLKGRDVRTCPENARSWARPQRGAWGERLGTTEGADAWDPRRSER
jgi:hypothetical protein